MKPLEDAMYTKWTGTAGIAAFFAGGLSKDVAPEGTALPHMAYQVISAPVDEMFGNSKRYTALVAFTGYGFDDAALLTGMKTFTDTFDDFIFTLSAGLNYDTRRTDEPICGLSVDADGKPIKQDGAFVYQCLCHYEISVTT